MRFFTFDPIRRRRGTVMLLVVAVLALLAVIGTVYVVSSRSQRTSSLALTANVNTNLAQQAVNAMVLQAMVSSSLNSDGMPGGASTAPGNKAARFYDYPEVGITLGAAKDSSDSLTPDEPWFVAHLHYPATPTTHANDLSLITQFPFDPVTGLYDGKNLVIYPAALPLNTKNGFNVVDDRTNSTVDPLTSDDPANTNPDAYINLLPFSDASGVRYRFGVRVIDTNRMANLNTGNPDDSLNATDPNGTWISSFRLAPASNYTGTNYFNAVEATPADLQTNTTLGRGGSSAYSIQNWENNLVLNIEKPADDTIIPFGLGDELELRSYGEFGTSYVPRFAIGFDVNSKTAIWPNTLSNIDPIGKKNVLGNPRRRNYTTYSYRKRVHV